MLDTHVVIVACENASGMPELVPVIASATKKEVAQGIHYERAKEKAVAMGYGVYSQAICFDRQDIEAFPSAQKTALYHLFKSLYNLQ